MKKAISLIMALVLCLSLCACGAKKVTSIVMSNSSVDITIGETVNLSAIVLPDDAEETIAWTSANESIATVDSTGKVTAVSIGNTTIIVASEGGVSASCTINVLDKSAYEKLNEIEKKFVDVFVSKCIDYFKVPDSVCIRKIAEYEGDASTGGDFWMIELSSTNGFGGTDVGVYFLSMNGSMFVDGGDSDMYRVDSYDCDLITAAIQERK